jgi:aminomethyltransferase
MHGANLLRTPLDAEHRALGAKFGPFAGWDMPIEYEGTLSEHRAVRERVGLFDLSHLGKVDVTGPGALQMLQWNLTNDLSRIAVGQAIYNLVLNDAGGVEEDLLAYRLDDERFFVVPNAANTDKVVGLLTGSARDAEVVLHEDWCFLGVQGPRSREVVGGLFPEAADLPFMGCAETSYRGERLVLARTGYTGELGFELFTHGRSASSLWAELLEAGQPFQIEPCGLGARDVLRLEMGYPLYGQDLLPDRSPLEAGLSWAVAMPKGEFRGRDALVRRRERAAPSRLRALVTDDRKYIPRARCSVFLSGRACGEVTSGSFSPVLRTGIALGYLAPPDEFEPGTTVEVEVRGRRGTAHIVKPPFVDRDPRKD